MFARTLLLVLLSASAATAEPLIFYGDGGSSNISLEGPAKLNLSLRYGEGAALIEEGRIRGVTPTTGMVWVINESNAATYDFDWAAAEAGMLRQSYVGFGATADGRRRGLRPCDGHSGKRLPWWPIQL